MSDFIDSAVKQQDVLNNAVIANRVRYAGISATVCVECAEPIPQGRRDAIPGVKLCVECAE